MTETKASTGVVRIEPYLYYEDVAAAVSWLSNAFGFRPLAEQQTDSNGVVTHAAMEHDGGVLMMGHPPDYKSPKRTGERCCTFYVYVTNIEAHFERAKAAGAPIIEALETTEYGHRRYGAEDLEGQHWYFAQPL
jgi:PhnB protein